ncbi:MAG TPA: UxaA family hydrolase [Halanaerobiales bacterium]|nr:UxaA family hydrolase [Halanaerobiales bacterium]
MKINILQISNKDNVAVLLSNGSRGDHFTFENEKINLKENINFGHKVALKSIKKGNKIIKYGEIIAYAKENIEPGNWVHNHNIVSDRGRLKDGEK